MELDECKDEWEIKNKKKNNNLEVIKNEYISYNFSHTFICKYKFAYYSGPVSHACISVHTIAYFERQ